MKEQLQKIYDDMLELASSGAKVLHNRCVEIAKKYNMPIKVKSSMEEGSGTIVKEVKDLEDICIRGVAKEDNIARVIAEAV